MKAALSQSIIDIGLSSRHGKNRSNHPGPIRNAHCRSREDIPQNLARPNRPNLVVVGGDDRRGGEGAGHVERPGR